VTTSHPLLARPLSRHRKKHTSVFFSGPRTILAGPRTMCVFSFSQTCLEELLDPRTPTSRHFGATRTRAFDSAQSTTQRVQSREAADRSSSACVSERPRCPRIMASPAQIYLKAALRAAMFAQRAASGTEMSLDGHLTDEAIVTKAAVPADEGRTTDLPISSSCDARSSHRALPRCC
jgi:hypothetical protein